MELLFAFLAVLVLLTVSAVAAYAACSNVHHTVAREIVSLVFISGRAPPWGKAYMFRG